MIVRGPEAGTSGRGRRSASDPGSVRGVLADPTFRSFLCGSVLSNIGTWLHNIAAGLLVYGLTRSTLLVGVVNFALFAGTFLLAPWSGGAADRFDRRRLLIVTQSLAAVIAATLATLTWFGLVTAWVVIASSLLLGLTLAFATPALMALVPQLVDKQRLDTAVALNSATFNLARAVGPVIGAAVVESAGFAAAFLLDALSFVAFALVLVTLKVTPNARAQGARPQLRESISYVRSKDRRVVLFVSVMAISIATDPSNTLVPEFVRDVFGVRDLYVGVLMGAFGAGATFTTLVLMSWLRRQPRILPYAMFVQGTGIIVVGVAPTIAVAMVGYFISGIGFIAGLTRCTSRIYSEVPDVQRGRVMALWSLAFLGTRPLASLIDGAIAEVAGVRVAAVTMAVPVLLVAMWVLRRVPAAPPASSSPGNRPGDAPVTPEITLRQMTADDLDAVLALNNAEVPRVSTLTRAELEQLVEWSTVAFVADASGTVAGFVLLLPPGRPYNSVNYVYFSRRGANWRYVDRVVIDPSFRRQGLASRLYDIVEEHTRKAGCRLVTCEVNVSPANDASLEFHGARGYVAVDEHDTPSGVRVRLFALEVART